MESKTGDGENSIVKMQFSRTGISVGIVEFIYFKGKL